MANGDDAQAIEPGNGRILGAGSNNLQKSIDTLNGSVQRLLTANSGGMGGGGRPPAVMTATPAAPEPQRPGGALVAQESRFPVPVSWADNGTGGNTTYTWGTPVRNTTPYVPRRPGGSPTITPSSWLTASARDLAKDNGGGDSGSSSGFKTAQRWIGRAQNFGDSQLKQALPMDNYAQWAAIQAGSPIGPDGTNGGAVNSIRKNMFGSQGTNQIMWAQNVQDASNAAFIASRNSGFSPLTAGSASQTNPAFSNYMGNIKDMALLNPMMNASSLANVMGTLSSTRGLYSSMMFGYKPVLGAGGTVDRNSLSAFSDSVMKSAYGKTSVAPENLKAGLGQNGILNANIQAYVNAAGGDQKTTTALEDYISGRNTATQKGLTGSQFDKLLKDYTAGGKGSQAAGDKLKNLGITNSILQSQKDLSGSKAQTTSDLLDSFGPAIKKANDALGDFYGVIDRIVNIPGLKQILGYTAGFGSVFGGAASAVVGGIGGFAAARGASGLLSGTASRLTVAGAASAIGGISTVATGGSLLLAAGVGAENRNKYEPKIKAFQQWEKDTYHLSSKQQATESGNTWLAHKKIFDQTSTRTTGNDGVSGGAAAAAAGGGGGSAAPTGGSVINGKTAAGAIRSALAEVGKPYQWGGTGPDSWDCSGLMQHAYGAIGVRLPRVSQQQMNAGQAVDRKDVQPGDLMFPNAGHVVMYIGGGKIVEAPRTGENVRTASVSEYGQYAAVRRIVASVGNLSGISSGSAPAQKQMANNSGGNAGSQVVGSGNYGSAEEVDVIQSALASGAVASSQAPKPNPAATSSTAAVTTSGPWKQDNASIQRAKSLGKQLAAQMYNWTGGEWDAIDKLFTGESGWRWWADNPSSHAYGIVQSLPGSKMASVGKDWKTNPATQLKWGYKYLHDRYGDPKNAYATWSARSPHWYDSGAWKIPDDQIAMVHKGEMIIPKPKAETIRNALMDDVVNVKSPSGGAMKNTGGQGLTLIFDKNSVSFNISGAMTEAQAQSAATAFVQTLANDKRLKSLAMGL